MLLGAAAVLSAAAFPAAIRAGARVAELVDAYATAHACAYRPHRDHVER